MTQMTPERWQQVTELLDAVLPHDPSRREKLLADLCQGDEELRREVESLLLYEEECVSILEEPLAPWHPAAGSPEESGNQDTTPAGAAEPTDSSGEANEVGLRIGRYRVLKRLGSGGMGTVYLAAREDDFRIKVALKRIKRRALSEEVLFRFENERQILADLGHPNIARILDAGKTGDLLPYFAMEYVEGRSIDRYCDRKRLNLRQRIELVLEVCSALQLAHQNLVVHRDLKPGNILVDRDGVPKLIDFGIAKHLEPDSVPHDVATRLGNQPMTVKYASPEQLWGLPITTASDIYSLGVMLYQLLTGHDPYPLDQGLVALRRAICELEPVTPSIAVGRTVEVWLSEDHHQRRTPESVSRARGTTPERLRRELAGDLDGILLKALRKRPENRYRSVEQLADDLRRHLQGLPVSACEGTFRYLAGKFVRRHMVGFMVASAVFLILAVSGLAVATLWRRAVEEESRIRAAVSERTMRLLEGMIEVYDPDIGGSQVTPLEFLNRTRQEITADYKSDSGLLADLLRGPLRRAYSRLGHHQEALSALDEALVNLRRLYPGDHADTAEVLLNLGTTHYRMGNYQAAKEHSKAALEMRQRLGMAEVDLAAPLGNLAAAHYQDGRLDEAAGLYLEALEILRRHLGPDAPELATQLRNLGMLEFARHRLAQAEPLLREALRIEVSASGAGTSRVANRRSDLGRVLFALGRTTEADRELMQALHIRFQRLDADHINVARAERNLAALMIESGELATAEVLLGHAQRAFRRASLRRQAPEDDWPTAEIESLIGGLLMARGRYSEAEACLVDSYHVIEAATGPASIYSRQALERVIQLYERWGNLDLFDKYSAIRERLE